MENIKDEKLLDILNRLEITDFSSLNESKFNDLLVCLDAELFKVVHHDKKLEKDLKDIKHQMKDLESHIDEMIEVEVQKVKEEDKEIIIETKTNSVNEMLANIAHQWRQPLSTISSAASGLSIQIQMGIAKTEDVNESLLKIISFTKFLSNTIEDFRDFFKEDKELKKLNILEIVQDTINIVEFSYQDNFIEIENNLDDVKNKSFDSLVYKSELSQVFLNIFNNAKDVLIDRDISERRIIINYEVEDKFNVIKIYDNAGGVSSEIKDNIFEAYFTTKHKSIGTGIGLFICKRIIEKNLKGSIQVKNTKKEIEGKTYKGAEFIIKIPKIK